jgi:hypothetical protein
MCRAKTSTKDELCDYVLFFGGDIKRDIHLWLEEDDFKALLYQQGELHGNILDFYLQFMLQLEKSVTKKHYHIVDN